MVNVSGLLNSDVSVALIRYEETVVNRSSTDFRCKKLKKPAWLTTRKNWFQLSLGLVR